VLFAEIGFRPVPRPRAKPIALAAVTGAALVALTGCDLQENADVENGRTLFVEKCGTCHAFKEAGTQAEVGPNLDAAFQGARNTGMDSDTIEGVVESQIENPRVTETDSPSYMPANLVEGDDARDVAAYVAQYAGVPGVEPPIPANAPPGAQVFLSQGCGSCHTLAALGDIATGTVGPDLDDVLPGMSEADIERSIVDPNADVEQGFPSGVMPDTYGDLPSKDIKELVDYLSEVAGQKQPAP
jgi:mono/diheme cytochrome c family protein